MEGRKKEVDGNMIGIGVTIVCVLLGILDELRLIRLRSAPSGADKRFRVVLAVLGIVGFLGALISLAK